MVKTNKSRNSVKRKTKQNKAKKPSHYMDAFFSSRAFFVKP